MKKGNTDNWSNIDGCQNLLFFAQLCDELLFDYSSPSNRISTLNSHFLCFDALSTMNDIDYRGVPEGTLKPIVEELFDALKKESAFILSNENPNKYFIKYSGDRFHVVKDTKELNYEDCKKAINTIYNQYFSDDKYYFQLKELITSIIKNNDTNEQESLFRLTKSLLTELVNRRYSLAYIYYHLIFCFFNRKTTVSSNEQIDSFFDGFTFDKHKYKVIFITENHSKNLDKYITQFSYKGNIEFKGDIDKKWLRKTEKQKYLIVNEMEALDPYSASKSAKWLFNIIVGCYKLYDHDYQCDLESSKCGVYDENFYFTEIKDSKSAVRKVRTPTKSVISEGMEKALKTIVEGDNGIVNAVNLHSISLNSEAEENQLLDLWAIIETILNVSNKHTSDRIQQICLILVPILKYKYIYSLFAQLSSDIKNYNEAKYQEIVGNSDDEFEIIHKITNYVLLEKFKTNRDQFLLSLNDFPLLKERITYYNKMLSTAKDIDAFIEKHTKRVRWQVMRIYRNRNLIIHNGDSMPYLTLLIENLHSYVDDLLYYSIESMSKGDDLESMYQKIYCKECEWLEKKNQKSIDVDSDFIKYLLQQ